MKPKVLIGGAHLHRPQRYVNKDPMPHIPFEPIDPPPSNAVYYVLLSMALTGILLLAVSCV